MPQDFLPHRLLNTRLSEGDVMLTRSAMYMRAKVRVARRRDVTFTSYMNYAQQKMMRGAQPQYRKAMRHDIITRHHEETYANIARDAL